MTVFATLLILDRQSQLVISWLHLGWHVDPVDDEVIATVIHADFGFHRQILVGNQATLRIANLIASLQLGLKAPLHFLCGNVVDFAVQKDVLTCLELILGKLLEGSISIDLGAERNRANLKIAHGS